MKRFLPLLSILILLGSCSKFNPEIDAVELEQYISYLASEELQGRLPGTEGDKAAASFIRSKFDDAGLQLLGEDGYQHFEITTGIKLGDGNMLSVGDSTYKLADHYMPLSFSGSGEINAEVVFAGYGFSIDSDTLSWDDYSGVDVKDKWALVFRADPDLDNIASSFAQFSTDRYKVMNASDHGAAGVILINTKDFDADDKLEKLKPQSGIGSATIPVIQVKREVAQYIINDTGKSIVDLETSFKTMYQSASFLTEKVLQGRVDIQPEKTTTMNVIGRLPGQSDEIVVMGAHYDHLGMGGESSRAPDTVAVHYGADDNASGTAMLIELAQKYSGVQPERTLLFIAFGAEEMGLLGSRHFVDNPLVNKDKIVMMFNFDMVGRMKKDNSISISGTGTAIETDSLLAVGIDSTKFIISKSPGGTGPSDHSSFYSEGIPVLFFSTGVHDQYHTPADQAELINYAGMQMLGNSVYDLAALYIDSDQSLTYQESQDPQRQGMRRRMKVTLGIVPDFAGGEVVGLGVAGVRSGGPAYNGGMKKGDIIKGIDGKDVTNIYDYMHRMGNYSKDDRITVEVLRGEEKVLLIIQL